MPAKGTRLGTARHLVPRQASQEGTPDQHEEGGWIYDCKGPDGWSIKIVKWPPGDYDSIDQGPMLDDPNCQLVGSFHTHAGAPSGHPENDGYKNELASDADRILPGDGDFPLAKIFARFREIGYAGFVSLELLNPIFWRTPPQQVGEIGLTALRVALGLNR